LVRTAEESQVRHAKVDDLDELHILDQNVFQQLGYPYFVLRQLFDLYRECWIVADHPAGLVGYSLGVPDFDRSTGWLLGLAVLPEYRRRGYGRLLTMASLRLLESTGVREICLTVEPRNQAATRLYGEVGFVRRRLVRDYLGPGHDRVIMGLSV
jgi:[ribosomal protein S18]-alanine N-acetyltransferase